MEPTTFSPPLLVEMPPPIAPPIAARRLRLPTHRIVCAVNRGSPDNNPVADGSEEGQPSNASCKETTFAAVAIEKIGSKIVRRYFMDEHQKLQVVDLEIRSGGTDTLKGNEVKALCLPIQTSQLFQEFFLPEDFPDSVSSDYLQYMLWQFPTNVTGWICSTLVTSSLLKAVGIGTWAGSAAAATAAIKWVSKDGLGALGRLFIGGRFARLFDDDPKQWRMYADIIGSAGSIFELATPLAPGYFLLLASLGHLTKAVAKGLKDPSFRVIQNHFAIAGNLGEVAAKEEVWEVAGELVGLALGVFLLGTPELSMSYPKLLFTWTSIRSLHLWLRYQSLASLRFSSINYKRAFLLVESHVSGSPILGIDDCNKGERLLMPWQFSRHYIHIGCSLTDAIGIQVSASKVEALLSLYCDEKHVLVVNSNELHGADIQILFKEGATSMTVLRGMWQAQWILYFGNFEKNKISTSTKPHCINIESQIKVSQSSLRELNTKFDSFIYELEHGGWNIQKLVLKIPNGTPVLVDVEKNTDLNYLENE